MDIELFACFHTMLDKHIDGNVADIVSTIFIYYEGSYENYTLLELIGLCHIHNVEITCPWNKKAIIKMLDDKKTTIPKKTDSIQSTEWEFYRVRKSLDVISTKYMDFDDCSRIIIQMPTGTIYMVDAYITSELIDPDDNNSWEKVAYILLENEENGEEYQVDPNEFFHVLDNDDITILQDTHRKYYANEEEKQKSENYIRWI